MNTLPRISVIVPAYNAAGHLPRCLRALAESTAEPHELFVVDDRSTDATAEIARTHGARVVTTPGRGGPGAARNLAATLATGDVLLFIDADVVVAPDTIARVAEHFAASDAPAALFGSYDDAPPERNFMSRYKNLQHHFVHQHGRPDASTFWAGCGAVRKPVFDELGGFDAARYAAPAIEDIELGARMKAAGHAIRLDRQITVKHLKRWSFAGVVRTDVFQRAIPWSRLLLERHEMVSDLNLKTSDRVSAALAWLALLSALATPFLPPAGLLTLACLVILVILNREFYVFCGRRGGLLFALGVIPMHVFYYLYSAAVFLWCWIEHHVLRRETRPAA